MFKDKVYEDMDDISKLVEPYQLKLNEELSQFPDEVEITPDLIISLGSNWGWYGISSHSIISNLADKLQLYELSSKAYETGRDFFEFKIADIEDGDYPTLDFINNTISHKIFLVKKKIAYEDEELERMVKRAIINPIRNRLSSNRTVNKPRLNEIADLFGAKKAMSERAYRLKVQELCKHLEDLVDQKKLDIRDIELCKKLGEWITMYVIDGNLPALNNLTRLKIMTHQNRPIYSIEERSTR